VRTQFYEPLIQQEQPQATPIRGFRTEIAGVYVLLDDVVTTLREFAQSLTDPEQGALIHEVATWLVSGERPTQYESVPETEEFPPAVEPPYGAESDDVTPDVARVELFPREESAGRRKWFARSIDTAGNVMKVTHGSFDKPFVEQNARDRWPDIPIHEVQDENESSMVKERGRRAYDHRLWTGLRSP